MAPPPTDPLADPLELEKQFQENLNLVTKAITRLNQEYEDLVKAVNGVLQKVSWASLAGALYLWKKIEDALKRLRTSIDQMVAEANKVLDQSTPVFSLFRRAFAWTNDVQGPVSSKVVVVRQDAQANLAHWQGAAERAYRQRQLFQGLATGATGDNAKDIAVWLGEFAALNVNFVLSIADALVQAATKLAELAIDGVLFNVLEAVDTGADAVGTALRSMWDMIKSMAEYGTGLAQKMLDASTILNAKNSYPDGHWPQAVTV